MSNGRKQTERLAIVALSVYRAIYTLLLIATAGLVNAQQYEPLLVTCENNDPFSERCKLNGPFVQTAASITQATLEEGEPTVDGSQSERSLWWEWTAPRDGWVDLLSESETFNPVLSAFKGQSLNGLSRIDGIEIESEGTPKESGLSFHVQSGESIQIAVQGPIESSGVVALEIVLRPINDDFRNRTIITVDENQVYLGSNEFADVEREEPDHNTTENSRASGKHSVWWSFIAPEDTTKVSVEVLKRELELDARLAIAVYQGTDFSTDFELLTSNFSASKNPFAFWVEPGETYHLAFDGLKPYGQEPIYSAPHVYGKFEFQVRNGRAISNDSFNTPLPVQRNVPAIASDLADATPEQSGEPFLTFYPSGSSLWWAWDSPDLSLSAMDVQTAGDIPDSESEHLSVARLPNDTIILRLTDLLGGNLEIRSDSNLLEPEQIEKFAQISQGLAEIEDLQSLPATVRMNITSLATEILGYQRCFTVEGIGNNPNGGEFDPAIGVFSGEIGADSVAMELGEGNVTFCVGPHSKRYLIGLEASNWINPARYELSLSEAQPPANDRFADAILIDEPGSYNGHNRSATFEDVEPIRADFQPSRSVWWQWSATESGVVEVSTRGSDFNSGLLLDIYTGSTLENLKAVAQNQRMADPPADYSYPGMSPIVTFEAITDTVYYLRIAGRRGSSIDVGNIELNLNCVDKAPNDDLFQAIEVTGDLLAGNNRGATTEPMEPLQGGFAATQSLWWRWQALTHSTVTLAHNQEGDSIPTRISVFSGPEPSDLSAFSQLIPITHNGADREYRDLVQFVADENTHYYFSIDSRSDRTGNISLEFLSLPGYRIGIPSIENDQITFTVSGDVAFVSPEFQLESSADLSEWDSIEGDFLLENGTFTYEGPLPSPSGLFFRAVGVPE